MATISSTLTLVDNMTNKLNTITDAVAEVQDNLSSISGKQDDLDKFSWDTFLSNAEAAGKRMEQIGQKMSLAITAPLVLLGKKMYGNATEYEAAYAKMRKTVEGGRATEEQYQQIADTAKELSETTPMSYVDLLGTAQDAGNAGVAIEQMEDFLTVYSALQYATDQHINGTQGIKAVASFLNITDGGVQDIEHFANSIAFLGVNANTTEDEILEMANRFASAATIAGFTKPQILGMAAAFESVGIRAEAGGSSAAKLIKQFQLSAEVGGQAQAKLDAIGEHFENGLAFSNYLAGLTKVDLVGLADSMGMTTEAVQSMADSWVLLEQFAEVSGKTSRQFIDDWAENPANAVSDFFYGLNRLGDDGAESILATLDKMGLTEIRESNLIAAMATRPEMFSNMIALAIQGYQENISMWEQFEQQMGTQESQNAMLGNKLDNTMADFGQNLVQAVQPALDVVNDLLTKFNSLSETDQDAVIKAFMIFAAGGPIVTAVGATVEAVSKIGNGVLYIINHSASWGTALQGFFSNPVFWGVAAGVGVALLIEKLESIPSKLETIIESAATIPLSFDQDTVNKTLEQIAEVQGQLDILNGNRFTEDAAKTSATIKLGYGTENMYNTALAYESAMANEEIERIYANYGAQIAQAQDQLINATTDAERISLSTEIEFLDAQMWAEVSAAQKTYSLAISDLFNGIVSQYPEQAAKLEEAAKQYDLLGAILQVQNFDYAGYEDQAQVQSVWNDMLKNMYTQAYNLGYGNKWGYTEQDIQLLDYNTSSSVNAALIEGLINDVAGNLEQAEQMISDNPMLSNFLQTILQSDSILENLDFTAVQGALDGMIETLDFAHAAQMAFENGNAKDFGSYIVQGLADDITANAGLMGPPMYDVRDEAVSSIQAAFDMHSPSQVMAALGIYIPEGIALGIRNGTGAVTAAVRTMANAMIAELKADLQIHSPSRVTYELGDFTGIGFANGILATQSEAEKAVGRIVSSAESVWNTATWSDIALFAGLEHDQLLNDAKDAVTISDADIRKIRELAEREVINNFTTAEVKVEMHNTNEIKSDMDLDGIVDYLGDKVSERLEAVAEGVYA